jgi:hypothetical protein
MIAHDKNEVNTEYNSHGFYVITPKESCEVTPLCCPVCDVVMRTREDDISYREFQFCERCTVLWAFAHREEWKNGWRPSRLEIDDANVARLPLVVELVIK